MCEPLPGDVLLAEIDELPPGVLTGDERATLQRLCGGIPDLGSCPTRMAAIDQMLAAVRARAGIELAEARAHRDDGADLAAAFRAILTS